MIRLAHGLFLISLDRFRELMADDYKEGLAICLTGKVK